MKSRHGPEPSATILGAVMSEKDQAGVSHNISKNNKPIDKARMYSSEHSNETPGLYSSRCAQNPSEEPRAQQCYRSLAFSELRTPLPRQSIGICVGPVGQSKSSRIRQPTCSRQRVKHISLKRPCTQ
ncbi:hypothetical protein LIA77_06153 [Sarocladium implicatum]|nr:hypothetical protein LIA77_06153 [Sarocladium implicatum]